MIISLSNYRRLSFILFLFISSISQGQIVSFEEVINAPLIDVGFSALEFSDIDNDGDQDLLITGSVDGDPQAVLYRNSGFGEFTEITNSIIAPVLGGAVAFADFDNDEDEDLIVLGYLSSLYRNDGAGNFSLIQDLPYGNYFGDVEFADVDSDGDLDFCRVGGYNTSLHINDGLGNFTENLDFPMIGLYAGSVAFGDIDGDGDMDIIGAGRALYDDIAPGNPGVVKIYLNDGLGNYTQHIGIDVFAGVKFSALALEDVDQDLDLDLILTGDDFWGEELSTYYMNDGSGNFSENGWVELNGVFRGTVDFADVNGDSYMDLLITGSTGEESIATLYTTDENGIFTEVMDTPFYGVSIGSAAFADIDGDNDIDLVISGQDAGFDPSTRLYLNNLNPSTHVDNSSDKSHLVSVFPTSYSATTTITCLGEFEYKVIDSMGKEVLEGISTDSQILNMHGFASGYYIIQVINGATIQSFKSYKL